MENKEITLNQILELVNSEHNDMVLGSKLRKLINQVKNKKG